MLSGLFGRRGPAPMVALAALAALALATAAAPATSAADGKSRDKAKAGAASKQARTPAKVNVAGREVSVDPVTGRLVKLTPEEARKLAAALGVMVTQAPEDLTVQQLADGTMMVDMQDSDQEIAVATLGATGEATVVCVHGAEAADAIVQQRLKVKSPVSGTSRKSRLNKESGKRGAAKAEEE